ncbi:MAG: hypothetical protein U5K43_09660 [Halofilum sp. (in: g-proteobacteria)]|nr:hypothetical protein [Halofilum sp. (in: g-proteobacteria)]
MRRSEWTQKQEDWLRRYFENELLPVISPMGLDPAHPFPRILNKSLNFIVSLRGKDAFGPQRRHGHRARRRAPCRARDRSCRRAAMATASTTSCS